MTAGQKEELIHVQWEGPFSLETMRGLDNPWDYGVYQIYGCHTVYGSAVLLYIGMAQDQTFSKRLSQENWLFNQDGSRIDIYVGRLSGNEKPSGEVWAQQIRDVESLLIYAHAPAANSRNVASIRDERLTCIHVLNWGESRDLLPEVSGHRWTRRHYDFDNYRAFGKP